MNETFLFFSGRLRNSSEIEIPSEWKKQVDISTLSICLTPIGIHQNLVIKRWTTKKIFLQSNSVVPIDCFYHVSAEKNDI